jgi:Inner membrane component of T3SS, cytoplasmic domain
MAKKLALAVQSGPAAGKLAKLKHRLEVGNDPGLGLVLDDTSAASCHARFTVKGGKVRVRDLDSAAGTFLNDVRVEGSKRVRAGDRVRIGSSVLELLTAEQATAWEHARHGAAPPGQATPAAVSALRVDQTEADFVPDLVAADDAAADRYGPLASWTDSHVKHQTYAAAIGLLAVSALAVLVFVIP